MERRPAWHDEAHRLHAEGLTQSAIGERVGKTRGAVGKALRPDRAKLYNARSNAQEERKHAKLQWNREHPPPPKLSVDPDPGIPGLLPVRRRQGDALVIVDFARVDIDDWEFLRKGRFSITARGYVQRGDHIRLHQLILPIAKGSGLECDHINRDKLDNRRQNLRAVTHLENNRNRGGRFDREARRVA